MTKKRKKNRMVMKMMVMRRTIMVLPGWKPHGEMAGYWHGKMGEGNGHGNEDDWEEKPEEKQEKQEKQETQRAAVPRESWMWTTRSSASPHPAAAVQCCRHHREASPGK